MTLVKMLNEDDVVRRLTTGEDPWLIDPQHGCMNPLTGWSPAAEMPPPNETLKGVRT